MKGWPRSQWALGQEKEGWRKSWVGSVELLGAMGGNSICELVPLRPAWSGHKMCRSLLSFIPDTFSLLAIRAASAPAEGDNTWRWRGGSRLRAMEGESGSGGEVRVVTAATTRSQTPLQSGHCPSHPGPSLHRNCASLALCVATKNWIPLLGAVSSA